MNGTTEVLQGDGDAVPPARKWRRLVRPVLSIALMVFLILVVLPNAVGTTASQVSKVLRETVNVFDIAFLFVVWATGVLLFTRTMTASLPGLSTRRAATLNVTGSSVSNVVPFGGAVGMSLNYVMIRSWGMDTTAFASFTVVTNIWVVLMKLALPAIAAVFLLSTGVSLSAGMTWSVAASAVALAAALGLVFTGLAKRALAVRIMGTLAPLVVRVGHLFRRHPDEARITAGVLAARDAVVSAVRNGWGQMAFGMIGWATSQVVLMWTCLSIVGAHLSPAIVFAAYACDRVLTFMILTPGASGFVETGTAFVLTYLAGGGVETGAMMTAGVLLYRAFDYGVEIPIGGIWLGTWLFLRRRKRKAEEIGA